MAFVLVLFLCFRKDMFTGREAEVRPERPLDRVLVSLSMASAAGLKQ